jgi:hypothetical protein
MAHLANESAKAISYNWPQPTLVSTDTSRKITDAETIDIAMAVTCSKRNFATKCPTTLYHSLVALAPRSHTTDATVTLIDKATTIANLLLAPKIPETTTTIKTISIAVVDTLATTHDDDNQHPNHPNPKTTALFFALWPGTRRNKADLIKPTIIPHNPHDSIDALASSHYNYKPDLTLTFNGDTTRTTVTLNDTSTSFDIQKYPVRPTLRS